MAVRVVTDSTSDLPEELRQASGVVTVPLRLHFDDRMFKDRVDISDEQFVSRLVQGSAPPTTSQPPPGDFEEVYRELLREPEDQVISIHIAAALSGTVSSATIAAEAVDPARIHVVDSRTVSLGTGFLVLEAVERAARGEPAEEIVRRLTEMHSRIGILCLMDTLKFLLLGGRIGRVRALLGSALSIKPLISLGIDGSVVPVGRVRSRSAGTRRLGELLQERMPLERIGVLYVGDSQDALSLADQTRRTFPGIEPLVHHASPVIATHSGPGTLAYAYLESAP